MFSENSLQPVIDDLCDSSKTFVQHNICTLSNNLITDQKGVKGSYNVYLSVIVKYKITDSYTIQMTINAAGKFVGQYFIIVQ